MNETAQNAPSAPKRDWSARRKSLRPMSIGGPQLDLVEVEPLHSDQGLPVVIRPRVRSLDPFAWVESNRAFIEEKLLESGGILFRDFGLRGPVDFERLVDATGVKRMFYVEGATPRTQLGEKIYTSTDFPSDQVIAPHNELCYVKAWPQKIFFFCVIPAQTEGATPIVDVRSVYRDIDPEVRQEFEAKGWMLRRNFGMGFGPAWQVSYRVETRAQLESYLEEADVRFEWLDEVRLRTTQIRPAVAKHPETGEMLWFNHIAFWHESSLEPSLREMFQRELGIENLPYNTYFGDGTPICADVAAELRRAYSANLTSFPWLEGDALMLDNMLAAHGRQAFTGERKVLTAMGQACSDRGVSLGN